MTAMAEPKPTRDQNRAQAAWRKIDDGRALAGDGRYGDDYKTQCRKLPALIHNCGLCQALAFLEAKGAGTDGGIHFRQVLNDLASVSGLAEDGPKLATKARTANVREYQRMTTEAMASAEWLKRYAEAALKE
jgi:CRISPR-associated protein Cmr5